MQQIDRPPLILSRLRIPCACGLRLTGCEYTFAGDILYVTGVCLDCGSQAAIFAPPVDTDTTAEVAAITREVADLVDLVLGRKAAMAQLTDGTEGE